MFEPLLPHNLAEFKRSRSIQRWTVVAAPICALLYGLLVALLVPPSWVNKVVAAALLVVAFLVMGFFEIKKGLVFRKDLKEREKTWLRSSDALEGPSNGEVGS